MVDICKLVEMVGIQDLLTLIKENSNERQALMDEVIKRDLDWRHLVEYDLKIESIIAYRRKHKCLLTEAKECVESYIRMMNS